MHSRQMASPSIFVVVLVGSPLTKISHSTTGQLWLVGWSFYVLATSKAISGWVLTCDSVHSCRLYTAVPMREQATNTMTQYPIQSHYPDTEPISPFPTLIMSSAWLWSDKNTFYVIGLTQWGFQIPQSTKSGDGCSTSFGHPVWFTRQLR